MGGNGQTGIDEVAVHRTVSSVMAEITRLVAYAACQGCGETLRDPYRVACCPHTICAACADFARTDAAKCPVRGCGLALRPADIVLDTDTKTIVDSILALESYAVKNRYAELKYFPEKQQTRQQSLDPEATNIERRENNARPVICIEASQETPEKNDWFQDQVVSQVQPSIDHVQPALLDALAKQSQNQRLLHAISPKSPVSSPSRNRSSFSPTPEEVAVPETPSQEYAEELVCRTASPVDATMSVQSLAPSDRQHLFVIPSSEPQSPAADACIREERDVGGERPEISSTPQLHRANGGDHDNVLASKHVGDNSSAAAVSSEHSKELRDAAEYAGDATRYLMKPTLPAVSLAASSELEYSEANIVVHLSKLPSVERKRCERICRGFGLEYIKTHDGPQEPTMIVTPLQVNDDGECKGAVQNISFGVLQAILKQIPILSPQWLYSSDNTGTLLPLQPFTSTSHSSSSSRTVFSGVHVALDPEYDEMIKTDIARLIVAGGGKMAESEDSLRNTEESCRLRVVIIPDNIALSPGDTVAASLQNEAGQCIIKVDFSWITDCILSGRCPPSSQHWVDSYTIQTPCSSGD